MLFGRYTAMLLLSIIGMAFPFVLKWAMTTGAEAEDDVVQIPICAIVALVFLLTVGHANSFIKVRSVPIV
jgi:hypothetical protein